MSTEADPTPAGSPTPLPIAPPAQPNLGHQLTAEEARFFETGELPAALTPPPAPAPVAAPPPTPAAPAPEPVAETQPRDDKGRFAPRSEAEPDTEFARVIAAEAARAAAAEAQLAALQARLDELTKPKPPPPPDRNSDPLGSLEHQIAEIAKHLTMLREDQTRAQQERAEREAQAAFAANIRAMRESFVKEAPDYDAAYKHLRSSRLEELELVGLSRQQAEQQLAQEEFALAAAEVRRGRNPVKTIYDLARKRGYAATSATPAPAQPKPEDKLANILAAASATQTVERGGTPSEAELTLATARNASPAQLDKLTADEAAWAKFTGSKTSLF